MADDIVTRLTMFSLDDGTDALNKLLGEAANEIERLRVDRTNWKQLAITDHLDVCNLDDHELCLSYLEWKISQAVRGG